MLAGCPRWQRAGVATSATVSLVGSTGSIGTQAIEVIETSAGRFRVVALAAWRSVDLLAAQAARAAARGRRHRRPAGLAAELAELVPEGTGGADRARGLSPRSPPADVVVNGVVGFAGLPSRWPPSRPGAGWPSPTRSR